MYSIVNASSSGRNVSFIILCKSRKHGLDWLFFFPNCFCSTLGKFLLVMILGKNTRN